MSDAQAKLVLYRSYLGTVQRFHDSSTRALGGYARVVDVVLNGDEVELRIETLHSAEPSGESWIEPNEGGVSPVPPPATIQLERRPEVRRVLREQRVQEGRPCARQADDEHWGIDLYGHGLYSYGLS